MADGSITTGTDALRLSPRLPDSRLAREQEDEVLAKGADAFDGDEKLQAIYRRAKELILRYDLFLFKQTLHTEGSTHLVICNTWRIEKSPEADITLSERDLVTGDWHRVTEDVLPGWPSFLLWPIRKHGHPKFWRAICSTIVDKALEAAAQIEGTDAAKEWGQGRSWLSESLGAHYLGRDSFVDMVSKWQPGALHPGGMIQAARALRAAFFDHVVDKELFSVALAIDYRDVDVGRYLKLAMHRGAVLRVAKERRNLVPLLPHIDSKQWHRDDLFARKWWIRGERQSTVIDRSSKRLSSFRSPAAWRWISRAPVSVVSTWMLRGDGSHDVIEALAEANVTAKVPIAAVRTYIASLYVVLIRLRAEVAIKVSRIYLQHAAQLWEKSGYPAFREWLRNNVGHEVISIRDYLAGEGMARGFPQKNSTWPSLLELSKDWHERIRIEAMKKDEERARATTWDSALPECEINGFTFSPLTSAWALANEGYDMNHCVGLYTQWCLKGVSRIFAVQSAEAPRATLEIRVDKRNCPVAQLLGAYNDHEVIAHYPAMRRAAEALARRYAKALQGERHRPVGEDT